MAKPNWFQRIGMRMAGFSDQAYMMTLGAYGNNAPNINDATFPKAYDICAWVFACVQAIAANVGSVPLDVYQKSGIADWVHDENGTTNLAKLLDYTNADDDICSLMELTAGWLGLHGNAYWHLMRPYPGAEPVGMRVLPADKIEVVPGKGIRSGTRAGYRILVGEQPVLPDIDVVHFRMLSMDAFYGIPPIKPLQTVINMWSAMTTYKYNLYKHGGIPPSIIKVDQPIVDEEQQMKFRSLWSFWRSPDAGGMPLVIGSSMEFLPAGLDPDRLAAPTLSLETRETICGVYGVPPSVVGLLDKVNYNTARTQRKQFWTETVVPKYLRRIITGINEQLSWQFSTKNKSARFRVQGDLSQIEALQEDKKEQAETARVWVESGVKTPNEVREELGLPASTTPGADDLQLNKSNPNPVSADALTQDAAKGLLSDLVDEIESRLGRTD